MKENECKDVVQRKNHAVEILEVKDILSLKKRYASNIRIDTRKIPYSYLLFSTHFHICFSFLNGEYSR